MMPKFLMQGKSIRVVTYIKERIAGLTMAQRLKGIRIAAYFLVFDGSLLLAGGFYLLHFAWTNNPTWLIRLAGIGSVLAFGFGLFSYLISAQFFARAPIWCRKPSGLEGS